MDYSAITDVVDLSPVATGIVLIFAAVAAIFVVLAAGRMLLDAIDGDDSHFDDEDGQDDLFEESDRLESNAEFQGGYYTDEQGEEAAWRLHQMDPDRIVIDHDLDD